MTNNDFIQWCRGFVNGAHSFNILPKQWTEFKEKLTTVKDNTPTTWITTPGWSQTTTWE